MEKLFSFVIILEKDKVLDPMERMQQQVDHLLVRQANYGQKIKELEQKVTSQSDTENRLVKSIEELNSQIKKSEESQKKILQQIEVLYARLGLEPVKNSVPQSHTLFKPDLYFDTDCVNKDRFNFSNSNKTLVSTFPYSTWPGILASQPLLPVMKQEFSIRIESPSNYVAVGYTCGKLKGSQIYYFAQGSCTFACNSNSIYLNGDYIKPGFTQTVSQGSVITVTIDFDTNYFLSK